jgi:hypothetical protein
MKMTIKETKQEAKEYIAWKAKQKYGHNPAKRSRIEWICRAAINHWSYELHCDDKHGVLGKKNAIYLKRGDKIIFVEDTPSYNNGYYEGPNRAWNDALDLLNLLKGRIDIINEMILLARSYTT